MTQQTLATELSFIKRFGAAEQEVLTPEAVDFLANLVVQFTDTRKKTISGSGYLAEEN